MSFRFSVLPMACCCAGASGQTIDVNVVLTGPPSAAALVQLAALGQLGDLIPAINGLTMRADAESLPAINALSCVAAAVPDGTAYGASVPVLPAAFTTGNNLWNLDAINVTEHGGGRTISYDGEGVYIAVVDSGLYHNWREYFPEDRVATQLGISFAGGGSGQANISTQPNRWEHDTNGHGTAVTAVLLGFAHQGTTQVFDGVAPRATIIPIRVLNESNSTKYSTFVRAIVHVGELKASGALGNAPVVLQTSIGGTLPDPLLEAAVAYTTAQGVAVVACAGNSGDAGMWYPAAYSQAISAAAWGWVGQFPIPDPSAVWWIVDDYPEVDPLAAFIPSYSSRPLAGQDLDVAGPTMVGVPSSAGGQVDYGFFAGTSAATPHVAGVAALMLQKNPTLLPAQIEAILEATAVPFAGGCRTVQDVGIGPGNWPTWSDAGNVFFVQVTQCWGPDAPGHGLLEAIGALNATPMP